MAEGISYKSRSIGHPVLAADPALKQRVTGFGWDEVTMIRSCKRNGRASSERLPFTAYHRCIRNPARAQAVLPAVQIDMIASVREMRSEENSFIIGFDSEFSYNEKNDQLMLSWQFSFCIPGEEGLVHQVVVFPGTERKLAFSAIINHILLIFRITERFGWAESHFDGFDYRDARCWEVPVMVKGKVKLERFTDFREAVSGCCDAEYSAALENLGPGVLCTYKYGTASDGSSERVPVNSVNGFALGYKINYAALNKYAIPVTIVCTYGNADLSVHVHISCNRTYGVSGNDIDDGNIFHDVRPQMFSISAVT